jgi:hypothetical protein
MTKTALFRILVIRNYLEFGAWDLVLKVHISFLALLNVSRVLPPRPKPEVG